jgi:hypothetical protein
MKTDPQNTDYQLEEGATRNYEHWRETEAVSDWGGDGLGFHGILSATA